MRILSLFLLGLLVVSSVMARPALAFETAAKQAVLVDLATGQVLLEKNADQAMPPSSMSKLMTLYVVFDRLKSGRLSLDDTLPVSEKAWKKGGSKMFVEVGKRVPVKDLLKGVAVQSGNDACIVLAEGISGSEEAFAKELNNVAKQIGLSGSHFMNSTGWPDDDHYVTARDLAILAEHIIRDFPEYYHLFSIPEFTYSGIRQPNRNWLLHRDVGVDGMKTGHTEAAGYGITISAIEGDRRLVLVVNGLNSEKQRADEAERLIRHGFRDFEVQEPFAMGDTIGEAEVWMGTSKTVPLVVAEPVRLSIPIAERDKVKLTLHHSEPVEAPITKGDVIASVRVDLPGGNSKEVELVAGHDVEKLSPLARIWPTAMHMLTQ